MSPPHDLDRLSHAELKGLVVKQCEQIVELQRMVAALRDEITRLKGVPGRPNLKPSGMERGTEPKPPGSCVERKRPRGSTRSKLAIHEERTVTLAPPRGSRFKGYTSFVVQDLTIRAHVVNFRCERWQTPDGDVMAAPLPAGINGHFGPELRRPPPRYGTCCMSTPAINLNNSPVMCDAAPLPDDAMLTLRGLALA